MKLHKIFLKDASPELLDELGKLNYKTTKEIKDKWCDSPMLDLIETVKHGGSKKAFAVYVTRYSKVIGWASLDGSNVNVFVLKKFRRRGIGKTLLLEMNKHRKTQVTVYPWDKKGLAFFERVKDLGCNLRMERCF